MMINNLDNTKIGKWVNKRFESIVELIEDALENIGFEPTTKVDKNGNVATYIAIDKNHFAIIDVYNIVMNAATKDLEYDSQLNDPFYEACKIRRAIRDRIVVLQTLYCESESIEKLMEISGKLPIRFLVIKRLK